MNSSNYIGTVDYDCVNSCSKEIGEFGVEYSCKGLKKRAATDVIKTSGCGPRSHCPFYKSKAQDAEERQKCRDRLYSLNLISRSQYRKQGGGDLL